MISWFGGVVPVYSGAVVWSPLLIALPNTILEGEGSYGYLLGKTICRIKEER